MSDRRAFFGEGGVGWVGLSLRRGGFLRRPKLPFFIHVSVYCVPEIISGISPKLRRTKLVESARDPFGITNLCATTTISAYYTWLYITIDQLLID